MPRRKPTNTFLRANSPLLTMVGLKRRVDAGDERGGKRTKVKQGAAPAKTTKPAPAKNAVPSKGLKKGAKPQKSNGKAQKKKTQEEESEDEDEFDIDNVSDSGLDSEDGDQNGGIKLDSASEDGDDDEEMEDDEGDEDESEGEDEEQSKKKDKSEKSTKPAADAKSMLPHTSHNQVS